jgi:hypothetical protein
LPFSAYDPDDIRLVQPYAFGGAIGLSLEQAAGEASVNADAMLRYSMSVWFLLSDGAE